MTLASRISTWKLATLAFLLLVALPAGVSSAIEEPGSLDTSFGGDGKVFTPFLPQDASAFAIALQPDGKLVVAGGVEPDFAFALARYNTDGTLDQTFGSGGKVMTDFPDIVSGAYAIGIQADGKIVAGGAGALVRYNTDGTPDQSFGGGDGMVAVNQVIDIAIQADGKILAGGQSVLARYNTDGTLDPTFGGGDGFVAGDSVFDIAIQTDGKIVAGLDSFVSRYNPDGSLDSAFGGDGSVGLGTCSGSTTYCYVRTVAIQPDGTILAGGGYSDCGGGPGGCNDLYAIFRYRPDGTPLTTIYGSDGVMFDVADIAIQADGKILAAGAHRGEGPLRFALVRRRTGGALDRTFAGDGIRYGRFNQNSVYFGAIALQADGRIVVVGGAEGRAHSKFALARYLAG